MSSTQQSSEPMRYKGIELARAKFHTEMRDQLRSFVEQRSFGLSESRSEEEDSGLQSEQWGSDDIESFLLRVTDLQKAIDNESGSAKKLIE